jgi:hypothetical protein
MSRAAFLASASSCALALWLAASCGQDVIDFPGGGGSGPGVGGSDGGGGQAEGGTGGAPFSCDDCEPPEAICVDEIECAAECPAGRAACATSDGLGDPSICCAGGEQCCTAAEHGYPGADVCAPAGSTCPIVCPDDVTVCPGDGFCALDAETGAYSCVAECHPYYACNETCCPLGSECDQGTCLLADLIIDEAYAQQTAELDTFNFQQGSCSFFEGCIAALGQRTLLRFSLRTPNAGIGDLFLGDPTGNDLFVYSPCHDHFHFEGYARYRLLDLEMNEVATGHKQAFCLLDFEQLSPNANPVAQYDCGWQGIQAGWADTYDKDLPCQWVDVTDVPPGQYLLEVIVNGDHTLGESDYTNNYALIPVTI